MNKAAYGAIDDIRKIPSRGIVRVSIEFPVESFLALVNMLDDKKVLLTEAPESIVKNFPYGVMDGNSVMDGNEEVAMIKESSPDFGHQARQLKKSDFFRRPEVWKVVGSDNEFLAWLRTQPCAKTKQRGHESNPIVAAHVRRVANGAGTGIKPPYSAIPLLQSLHAEQHQKGEDAVAPKEWWDKQRIHHLMKWCWEKLKADFKVGSWKQFDPEILAEWASNKAVYQYLPSCYQVLDVDEVA